MTTKSRTKSADSVGCSWWPECPNCGSNVKQGRLCKDCGHRHSDHEHTHMARRNTDQAGWYAIIAEQIQWADDRRPTERPVRALRESVYTTMEACDLEFEPYKNYSP